MEGEERQEGRKGGPGGSIPSDCVWRCEVLGRESTVIYCALCTSAVLPGASSAGCAALQHSAASLV